MREKKILSKRLGETSADLGELKQACKYYDDVLDYFAENDCDTNWAKLCLAETHLLYGKALFDFGYYEAADDQITDDDSAIRGPRQHVDAAVKILDSQDLNGDGSFMGKVESAKRSANILLGKVWLNRGKEELALKYFKGRMKK